MNYYTSQKDLRLYSSPSLSEDLSAASPYCDSALSSPTMDYSDFDLLHSPFEPVPDTDVTLEHLHDAQPGDEPGYPIHKLIQYAIQGSQTGKLCLRDILGAIKAKFPLWYAPAKRQEKLYVTVRHHLSWYPKFVTAGKPVGVPGKSRWWTIDASMLDEPPRSKAKRVAKAASVSYEEPSAGPSRTPKRKAAVKAAIAKPTRSSQRRRNSTIKPPVLPEELSNTQDSVQSFRPRHGRFPSEASSASSASSQLAQSPDYTSASSHDTPMTPLFPSELPPCTPQFSYTTDLTVNDTSSQLIDWSYAHSQPPPSTSQVCIPPPPATVFPAFNTLPLPPAPYFQPSHLYNPYPYYFTSEPSEPTAPTAPLIEFDLEAMLDALTEPSFSTCTW